VDSNIDDTVNGEAKINIPTICFNMLENDMQFANKNKIGNIIFVNLNAGLPRIVHITDNDAGTINDNINDINSNHTSCKFVFGSQCTETLLNTNTDMKNQKNNNNYINSDDNDENNECKNDNIDNNNSTYNKNNDDVNNNTIKSNDETDLTTNLFHCDHCNKSFATRGYLHQHERIHSNLRPYICNQCNSSFKQKSHLNQHIRSQHLNEKPYACQYCLLRFYQKSHLQNHIRAVHTGVKPFPCDICGKQFAQISGARQCRHYGTNKHGIKSIYQKQKLDKN